MGIDTDSEDKLKKIGRMVVVALVSLVMILFIYFVGAQTMKPNSWVAEAAKNHFAAIIGLPFVAALSFFIVVTLEISFGVIEFEGLTFKFKGASGPIVLWALCFLVISIAVKMLW